MSFSAFIFDMDGTLIDNMGFHSNIWIEFLASHGVQITPEMFASRTVGKINAEILREFIGPHLTAGQIAALSLGKEELFRERFRPHIKEVPGLRAFLEAARGCAIPAALATSAGIDNARYILQGLGVESFFSVVVTAEDITRGKPDPEIFLIAARRLGLIPGTCLVFEDSPMGLEAAHLAGMRAVALATTFPAAKLETHPAVLRVVPDYTGLDAHLLATG
jgi:HAD superfamily hydrolase (TIGR01509 family)